MGQAVVPVSAQPGQGGNILVTNLSSTQTVVIGRMEIPPKAEWLMPVRDLTGSSRKGGKVEIRGVDHEGIVIRNTSGAPKNIMGVTFQPNEIKTIHVTIKPQPQPQS